MEPKFLFVRAVDFWYEELDNLGDKLALLPGDGLAALLARPHGVPLLVPLPQGDAILLGHVLTLGDHLGVGHRLGPRLAGLLHKQLWSQLRLGSCLFFHTHLTF